MTADEPLGQRAERLVTRPVSDRLRRLGSLPPIESTRGQIGSFLSACLTGAEVIEALAAVTAAATEDRA